MGSLSRTATVLELQRDAVLLVEDGNHGEYRPRPEEFTDTGTAFIRAADMVDGRVVFESASRIDAIARRRITKGIGAPGDVLLSHKGTVGKVALVRSDAPAFVCSPQTTFWRSLDPGTLDREYLYAFLRSPEFHCQLASRSGETDMAPYVSLTSQRGLTVTLPPIGVQRAIGAFVSALDDKIELNRRMSETLEAMARALFKSWFVDFDPVRAKSESREPGLAPAITALFPESFTTTSLGEIPEGWSVGRLDDALVLKRGFDLPSPVRKPGSYRVIAAGGDNGSHAHFMVRGPGVVTGRSGVLGKVFFVHDDFWPLNTSLWVEQFRGASACYAYELLRTLDFDAFNAGSAVPTLNRNHVHGLPIVLPSRNSVDAFEATAAELMKRRRASDDECGTLAALRDTLLPKLISGELCVPNAERLVAGSV